MSEDDQINMFSKDSYVTKMIEKMRGIEEMKISGNDIADMLLMLQVQQLLFYNITSTTVYAGNGEADKANEHLREIRKYLKLHDEAIRNLHRRFADRMAGMLRNG
ncbi:hypothetical protein [Methylobacterium sp. 17Sr1-1]|uniref:hypothetical protein n=1 Tax=Methylobacterium sp. 17Sr1-1 TaxID=2202826 RepID=UPI0013A578FC|nr:hypothetical protein [Methylobacterium sp. 17Sr1-1]